MSSIKERSTRVVATLKNIVRRKWCWKPLAQESQARSGLVSCLEPELTSGDGVTPQTQTEDQSCEESFPLRLRLKFYFKLFKGQIQF